MNNLKAVIFDVDGTLAETERDGHRPAFNAAFKEFGLDWEWDVPHHGEFLAVTGGKERMRAYCQKYRTAFLEDSRNGVLAARGAGLPVLVVESSYTVGEDFSAAVAVLSDLGEPGAPGHTLQGKAPERGFADTAYLVTLVGSGIA